MKKLKRLASIALLLLPTAATFSQMDTEGLVSTCGESLQGETMVIDFSMGIWTALNMENSNGQITNGIQQSDYFIVTNLTEEKLAANIEIFPNPTVGHINIIIDNDIQDDMTAVLRNAEGKVVLTQPIEKSTMMDLEHLPTQLYYLSLTDLDGTTIQHFKIIKLK